MNWLTLDQQRQIRTLSAQNPTEECCGFVLETGEVISVDNKAADRSNAFEVDPLDFARWEESIKGVWHSHLTLAGFSPLDQQVIAADDLPWAVYCLRDDSFHQCNPKSIAPLVGRPFCYGLYDCYSLITDKMAEMGVQLPPWPRGRFGEWNEPQFLPFDQMALVVGKAVPAGQYQEGDLMAFNLGDHPNHTDHVGVFVSPTHFLHHPVGKLSRIDRFGGWWSRRLRLVVRPHALWAS